MVVSPPSSRVRSSQPCPLEAGANTACDLCARARARPNSAGSPSCLANATNPGLDTCGASSRSLSPSHALGPEMSAQASTRAPPATARTACEPPIEAPTRTTRRTDNRCRRWSAAMVTCREMCASFAQVDPPNPQGSIGIADTPSPASASANRIEPHSPPISGRRITPTSRLESGGTSTAPTRRIPADFSVTSAASTSRGAKLMQRSANALGVANGRDRSGGSAAGATTVLRDSPAVHTTAVVISTSATKKAARARPLGDIAAVFRNRSKWATLILHVPDRRRNNARGGQAGSLVGAWVTQGLARLGAPRSHQSMDGPSRNWPAVSSMTSALGSVMCPQLGHAARARAAATRTPAAC